MTEHDPIREWSAQKERAEYLLNVTARLRNGEILHREAVAALLVAGVPEKLATKALGSLRSDPTGGPLPTEPAEPVDDPDPFMKP